MFPFEVFRAEESAVNLLQQVCWRDGLYCPHCLSESVINYGSYRAYQRYYCKDCERTFNDRTGTIFGHAKIALDDPLFAFYSLFRFNTSIRQLDAKLDISYRTLRQRLEQFPGTLNAPSLDLVGPVEIDEVYITAELKGRERDQESHSYGLSKPRRGSYAEDNPPVFTLADHGNDQRYVVPAKSTDKPTVRLLLNNHEEKSLTVYTGGF